MQLETQRLSLRQWKESDFAVFAEMNSDAEVMQYYPNTLSEEESNNLAQKIMSLISQRGWGFWAVERKIDKRFIGFVGLHKPTYQLPVSPCVEIGWRLAKKYWCQGYATEAGLACLRIAFVELKLDEVYSFTSVANKRSWSVMQRLGLINTGNNFEHPILPEGHALREHVLYKITKDTWIKNTSR